MPEKSNAPRNGGASRNSFAGLFRAPSTAADVQAQFLIAAHHIRPEMAAMMANLIFGGGCHG
jgi:hypothetical protein